MLFKIQNPEYFITRFSNVEYKFRSSQVRYGSWPDRDPCVMLCLFLFVPGIRVPWIFRVPPLCVGLLTCLFTLFTQLPLYTKYNLEKLFHPPWSFQKGLLHLNSIFPVRRFPHKLLTYSWLYRPHVFHSMFYSVRLSVLENVWYGRISDTVSEIFKHRNFVTLRWLSKHRSYTVLS